MTTIAPTAPDTGAVLSATGVTKRYALPVTVVDRVRRTERPALKALDGIDLDLRRGEVLALVGESGSGKSTLAKILVGSVTATTGRVDADGAPLPVHRDREASRRIQMVFQDPYSSLNPRMSVGSMLRELLLLHRIVPRNEVRAESIRVLGLVGLDEDALDAYPSQFSGGQRQRIAIARAIAVRPDVLIADEPVSALDVSVQATILELFARLQRELGLSILFVAHNLAVVQHLSQRVAVMYLGRIVEVADTAELFRNPRHPYTRALIDSIPRMGTEDAMSRLALQGDPPSPFDVPSGCRFHPRCPYAVDACRTVDPALEPVPVVIGARPTSAGGLPGGDATSAAHVAACIRSAELGDVDPLREPAIELDDPALTEPEVLLDPDALVEGDPVDRRQTATPAHPAQHRTAPHHPAEPHQPTAPHEGRPA
ncbi:ABC transporter ATP-binding protein [Curtobacterium sp. MCBD17_003]|uniref:ABC transporter ATP-binding protein n=1 Tax=Curtobacterium sp. MCBD17_003 TaxID=2175667 RepID=UPI001C650697|nr:ABC transporter ATP-binding protein [Curtobacterium sp. MCBD17_003]WIE54509.1 ABC transporter ATP-binding protein [Curtobacterium sp. MCBD17_003]